MIRLTNIATTRKRTLRQVLLAGIAACCTAMVSVPAYAQDEEIADKSGNDPRDFASKFMPYYRYTELRNGMTMKEFTWFHFFALTKTVALTVEVPVATQYDITETPQCSGLPEIDCTGSIPGSGRLPNGLPAEGDGVENGIGDTILRVIVNPKKKLFGGTFLPGIQFNLPTATDDVLGSETFAGGPIATFVWDVKKWPAPGAFFAMMNIYYWDWFKDSDRSGTSMYLGRWFLQLPINKKHQLYLMTEMQPIYNFKESDFTFWIGPEFGKAILPNRGLFRNGGAIYFKPGYGADSNSGSSQREWSWEIGFRMFFPAGPEAVDMMSADAVDITDKINALAQRRNLTDSLADSGRYGR